MKHTSLLLLLSLLLLAACSTSSTDSSSTSSSDWNQTTAPGPAKSNTSREISLSGDNGRVNGKIIPGKESSIITRNQSLQGIYTKSDKKKYKENGNTIAEVKMKNYGFKVRTPNGDLLWKVKRQDDGDIKISDNEEGLNAFQIKITDSGKIKLKRGEKEINKMDYDANRGTLLFDTGHSVQAQPSINPQYLGVMAIIDIQAPYNYIILTELLSR